MSQSNQGGRQDDRQQGQSPDNLHLVCGAGGVRAILASTGAIMVAHKAGITRFATVGGASGGTIPAVMVASGKHPAEIAHMVIGVDFTSLLTRHAGLPQIVLAYFFKDTLYRLFRPRIGLYGTEKLGKFIEQLVPEWPENFWTVASSGTSQLLFTRDSITEYRMNGCRKLISRKTIPLPLAVRATMAIPGVFDAVRWRNLYLHDGALSVDGRTPIRPIGRHFGGQPEMIMAIDVGQDSNRGSLVHRIYQRIFWRVFCGRHCPAEGHFPLGYEGTILIKPDPYCVESLKFDLTPDQKWTVIMAGFTAAIEPLQKVGLLKGEQLEEVNSIHRAYEEIRASVSDPAQRAKLVENLMVSHGLY